ncbi:MAG TPA: DUF1732 domain-containing protein [Polyangiales bacterium]|nr:DUF1732 domain-containing protein [Polyangiales bacterium]
MTGYGRGQAALGTATYVVELRAVNHRFLDLRVRTDPELSGESHVLEAHVRKLALRGRIDISARLEGKPPGAIAIDRDRARAAFAELRALRDELAPDEPLPLTLLSSLPALFGESRGPSAELRLAAAERAVQAACAELQRMRAVEGQALREDLDKRSARALELVEQIAAVTADQGAQIRAKLLTRIHKLLEGSSDMPLDAGRLELEVALAADRADVTEELTRLRSHLAQLRELSAESPEPVGRKLDFLLQEMGREANTTGAKIAEVRAAAHVLELKAELERMREQVQNVL